MTEWEPSRPLPSGPEDVGTRVSAVIGIQTAFVVADRGLGMPIPMPHAFESTGDPYDGAFVPCAIGVMAVGAAEQAAERLEAAHYERAAKCVRIGGHVAAYAGMLAYEIGARGTESKVQIATGAIGTLFGTLAGKYYGGPWLQWRAERRPRPEL